MSNFDDVVEYFGNQSALAEKLGVSRAAVTAWRERGGFPPFRSIQIEELSGGKFRACDISLRLDDKKEGGEL